MQIIPAVTPKKTVMYDPIKKQIITETADVIGLIEMPDPDNENVIAIIPMYMSSDSFGFYALPQLSPAFLGFVGLNDLVSLGDYKSKIDEINKEYDKFAAQFEEIEVEKEGNVSHIRRIIREKKPPTEKE